MVEIQETELNELNWTERMSWSEDGLDSEFFGVLPFSCQKQKRILPPKGILFVQKGKTQSRLYLQKRQTSYFRPNWRPSLLGYKKRLDVSRPCGWRVLVDKAARWPARRAFYVSFWDCHSLSLPLLLLYLFFAGLFGGVDVECTLATIATATCSWKDRPTPPRTRFCTRPEVAAKKMIGRSGLRSCF